MSVITTSQANNSSNWITYAIANSLRYRVSTRFSITNSQTFNSVVFKLTRSSGMTGSVRVKIYDAKYINPFYYPSSDGGLTSTTNFSNPLATSDAINIETLAVKFTGITSSSNNITFTFPSTTIGVASQIKNYCAVVEVINDNIISSDTENKGVYVWEANVSGSTNTVQYDSTTYSWLSNQGWEPYFTLQSLVLNSAPTNISLSSSSIAENAAANATVGTLSATDAEGGVMSFALVAGAGDTDNASFMINANQLKLANGVSLNYETKSSYSVRLKATDSSSLSYEKPFTISVTNVNEAPTNISLSATSITEGNEINAVIGILSAIEADVGDSVSFSVVSGDDKFNISGNELRASVVFDRDTETSHSVVVRAADAGGLSLDQSFTISVLNAGPTSISLSNASISESASSQATVGMLSAVDPGGGSCSFALVSGAGSDDNATFALSGNELMLASGVSLDYETKNSYSIRVQALDSDGATVQQSFTISVLNENEMPSSISLSATSIQEGNAVGAVIGLLSAGDPDVGDSVSFAVVSGSDKFEVVGNQLKALISFDYEASSSHSVVIRGTDMDGLFKDQSFTIAVINSASDDPVSLPTMGLPTLAAGQVITSVSVNPMIVDVTMNGQPLPVGSVLRNTVSGQKFIKIEGGTREFLAVEIEPRPVWEWAESADELWETLQQL